jgi:hypothetical protein
VLDRCATAATQAVISLRRTAADFLTAPESGREPTPISLIVAAAGNVCTCRRKSCGHPSEETSATARMPRRPWAVAQACISRRHVWLKPKGGLRRTSNCCTKSDRNGVKVDEVTDHQTVDHDRQSQDEYQPRGTLLEGIEGHRGQARHERTERCGVGSWRTASRQLVIVS